MTDSYLLEHEQRIPRPIDEVFSFFSDAENLERITPPWLNFKIVSPRPIAIAAGARIVYRLKWRGIPMRWITEIAEWSPPHRFVDLQLQGPYRLWRHTHTFEPDGDGTHMRDEVRYELPFGPIGRIVHALSVRRNVRAIFDYRARVIQQILGAKA
jgi:ligand-binding SRPBCC domain-containing protein